MCSILCQKRTPLSVMISVLLISSSFSIQAQEEKTDLGRIQVSDNKEKDKQGYDQVYERDVASVYLGKELLERYQGTSPADLLKSAIGVYSGEARNGGALDPNIRGIQGQGRIPVTVDGTEQAITVYRGYNGATNRNYIDSNLISSIYIEKGPSLTPNMKTGIGGGIAIKTLSIRDIVPIGESFGINIKGDISNNTAHYKDIYVDMLGEYRNYSHFYHQGVRQIDPALEITPQNNKATTFNDYAIRLGVGFDEEYFNLLFAYAIREKGNYLAGKRNADKYLETNEMDSIYSKDKKIRLTPYIPFIAHIYRPGNEVPNTSSQTRSFLVKGNLFPQSEHRLAVHYRYSDLLFGDIMPSRLEWVRYDKNLVNQWPLANITQQAGTLTYQWKPEQRHADLLLRIWGNLTSGHTNSRGGAPRQPKQYDIGRRNKWDLSFDTRFIDTASLYQKNNRYGLDLSSTFQLSPIFSFSVMGNYSFEWLKSHEINLPPGINQFVTEGRSGRRQEINLAFSTDWRPISWLAINAGGKYGSYWAKDDFLNKMRRNKVDSYKKRQTLRGYLVPYKRVLTAEEYLYYRAWHRIDSDTLPEEYKNYRRHPELHQKIYEFAKNKITHSKYLEMPENIKEALNKRSDINNRQVFYEYNSYIRDADTGKIQIETDDVTPMKNEFTPWLFNDDSELTKSNNILLNGDVDMQEKVIHPITGKSVYKNEMVPLTHGSAIYSEDKIEDLYEEQPAYHHGAWAPLISATFYINDMVRLYGRYTEQLRLPNLFEDTSGFSGLRASYHGFKLQPERAKSTELGVVLDLSDWLNVQHHADIKFNYFNTNIENVFDRDVSWQIRQLDKQKLEGLEIQARFDNGFIFMDTALVYNHKNVVCDKNAYSFFDPSGLTNMKTCMTGGYPGGFLRTSIQPKYSVNLHLGTRWLNNALEIGSRFLYSTEVENKDEKWLKENYPSQYFGINNNPMRWASVFTADAYINYQYSPDLSFEIVGSNLLNEYYIDPLTRSGMPAPGRTIKLGVTAQF